MRECVRRMPVAVLVAVVVGLGSAGRASAQAACDRACLRTMLDQYLAAVVKHDPKAAPLIVGFRQTENAVNVAPGNGVWKTVTGLGKMQRRYLDPVSGQAGYYGLVEEGASVALVTVRLRVQNRRLTEAEWYIARENDPGLNGPRQPGRPPANLFNPDYLIANPPPDRVVPPAKRLSREELDRGDPELLRRHHLARRHRGADAPRVRPRRERIAGARRQVPAAGAAACRGGCASRTAARRVVERLRGRARELQPLDGGGDAHSAGGRRSAGDAWTGRLHPPPRLAHAAQRVQRVVQRRGRPHQDDLHGDVLSAGHAARCRTGRPTTATGRWPTGIVPPPPEPK